MKGTPLFPDVVVNGKTIPSADIAAEAQNHEAPKTKPGLAWKAAARALVVKELLLSAAGEAGIEAAPELRGPGKRETADEALIRAFLDREMQPEPVTEAACKEVYESRPAEAKAAAYDDVVRDIHDWLERKEWARAAQAFVADLVEKAEITGVDMTPSAAEKEMLQKAG